MRTWAKSEWALCAAIGWFLAGSTRADHVMVAVSVALLVARSILSAVGAAPREE